PAAGEPVRFGAHVNTDCSPVVYDWEIYDELMFMIDESDQAEPVFVFPAEGMYFLHLTIAAGVDVQDVWFFFFVDAGYNYYFYDDEGQLEGAVNTNTGRFRIILPDRPMSSGWFIDYGWFDDRAVTPEGWTVLGLHSSAGLPWIANIGIILDLDIVHGFFLYKDRGVYIDFTDRPGQ
ncbi:MAG: PKD domain-containing protein, partial [Acidobacteria bacterium]|nr:PKD domain-containing protein [Acidobacteriota bacterium]